MKELLQVFVFLVGCGCIAMSARYLVFFIGANREIGRSMVFMLAEQIVTACCTLAFSFNSLIATISGNPEAQWNSIKTEVAIFLRLLMFGVMIWSTFHLSRSVKRIVRGKDANS